MFKRLFKKNAVSNTEHIKEVTIQCACEGSNEHCDLVLQLREKQALKKDIEDKINALNIDSIPSLFNFVDFLRTLERNGFVLDRNTRHSIVCNDIDIDILKHTIRQYSSADIFRITEELKTYGNKADIINEKKRALKAVNDDIKNIKSKLGIE